MLREKLSLFAGIVLFLTASGQSTYQQIAGDTIVASPQFLGKTYFLSGKKLNLAVMQWFMSDHPKAREEIQLAVFTDQLSLTGYTLGGIFLLTGMAFDQQNKAASRDLLILGGVGLGTGLLFQLISTGFKKKAVRLYNENIKARYRQRDVSLRVKPNKDGLSVGLSF